MNEGRVEFRVVGDNEIGIFKEVDKDAGVPREWILSGEHRVCVAVNGSRIRMAAAAGIEDEMREVEDETAFSKLRRLKSDDSKTDNPVDCWGESCRLDIDKCDAGRQSTQPMVGRDHFPV